MALCGPPGEGAVRLALVHDGETEGFVGGMA
jgi:hypothetical protein